MCRAGRLDVKSICMRHAGMQKSIYGHVKNEKIMLGRTGSPTGLGHLQLRTVCHFYFSLFIVVMLNVMYVLHSVFTWVISNRELPAFL
jgi:hypothetical protein